MNYESEKNKINKILKPNGKIIQLKPEDKNLHSNCYDLKILDNNKKITIKYPGYKTTVTKCDYCVYLFDGKSEKPISHIDIMNDLYYKTTSENYNNIKTYIEDVAKGNKNIIQSNYTGINFNLGFTFDELTNLMFYIAIQEDINYPGNRYQGRKMCFFRYVEAIYCKVFANHTLDEACSRVNVNYIPENWNDVGDLYNNITNIQR